MKGTIPYLKAFADGHSTEKQQLENGEIERVEESWHAFSKELVRTFALFSVKLKRTGKNFRVILDYGDVTLCFGGYIYKY